MRLLFCVLLVLATACTPREKTITIIAVNDIHGGIDNFPRLATLVQQYRGADSLHTIVVDAGDRWTGNPFVDLNPERGQPVIDLLNALGVNVATYGNHEFDFGLDVLRKRVQEADYPFTAANIDSNFSPLPQPDPYICMNVDGVKLCFLGLITTARAGYPDGFVENFGSIKFSNPITTALEYRHLRDKADVLIGLTHIGYELDSVLAVQMPELDLILGGHSHTLVPDGHVIGRTLVTQASSRLKYANVVTIKMRGDKIADIRGRLVKLDTVAPDPKFVAMVEAYAQLPELNEVKGALATKSDKTGVMNMVTDIIRKSTGSDMAIYNWGGIRVDSLVAGPMTVADFYSIEPFGNTVVVLKMTEEQIRGLILRKFNSLGKEARREDLYPSGFTYHVRTSVQGDGLDLYIKTKAKPGPDGTYKVAMSDYVDSIYDFDGAGTGEPTGVVVAHMLMQYFEKNSPVSSDNEARTSVGR
ncbi:MAG: bifunctional metallophosphatase/5'-nucleotidase [Rikenellaceae bacterium]|jgi:5'-nucleotidase|nr:bifunctional metallophosphatase/5'-nucleotidase [Rikenellaceae bacterium]